MDSYAWGLIGGLIGGLLVHVFVGNPFKPTKDKGARDAIVALGKEFNRTVHIYDYDIRALIHVTNHEKEAYVTKMTVVEARKNVEAWNARVDGVVKKVVLLYKHLGLHIEQVPAQEKIVKARR